MWGLDDKSRCRIEVEKSGCWVNFLNFRLKVGFFLKFFLIYISFYIRGGVCACVCTCGGVGFVIEIVYLKF